MIEKVECPFCGEVFPIKFDDAETAKHPISEICPMTQISIHKDQWKMRPKKKESGDIPRIQNEVEWLRSIVVAFIGMDKNQGSKGFRE